MDFIIIHVKVPYKGKIRKYPKDTLKELVRNINTDAQKRMIDFYINVKHCIKNECSICLEDVKTLTVSFQMCGHFFHSACIGQWKKINSSCPYCRTKL